MVVKSSTQTNKNYRLGGDRANSPLLSVQNRQTLRSKGEPRGARRDGGVNEGLVTIRASSQLGPALIHRSGLWLQARLVVPG